MARSGGAYGEPYNHSTKSLRCSRLTFRRTRPYTTPWRGTHKGVAVGPRAVSRWLRAMRQVRMCDGARPWAGPVELAECRRKPYLLVGRRAARFVSVLCLALALAVLVLRDHAGDRRNHVTLVEGHEPNALRVAPRDAHLIHRRPDHDAPVSDQHDLVFGQDLH